MIGSEIKGDFTGNLTEQNYKSFIDGYVQTIKNGLEVGVGSSKFITETSGIESLDHLINPDEDWGVSFLYNGDAQYAHIGGSQYDGDNTNSAWAEQGDNIRFATPKNPIFLLDGFVMSSRVDKEELKTQLYNTIYKAIFEGAYKTPEQLKEIEDTDKVYRPLIKDIANILSIAGNNNFKSKLQTQYGISDIYAQTIVNMNLNKITGTDKEKEEEAISRLDIYGHLNNSRVYKNYDYVGYTTPFNVVYNYVNDDDTNGYFEDDFIGKSLLPIAGVPKLNQIIAPIDDKLQNDYLIYYEQETKS